MGKRTMLFDFKALQWEYRAISGKWEIKRAGKIIHEKYFLRLILKTTVLAHNSFERS